MITNRPAPQQQKDAVHVSELVDLLADQGTPLDVKIQAAVMLQHLTYLDPFVKAEVASFNVAHHLIALLAAHHRNAQIPRIFALSVLGALRNLCSGADSTARRAITSLENNNLAVVLDVIGAHQAIEAEETAVRELATAVLWNISVDTEVVTRLTEDGVLDVISRVIILPSIQFASKTPYSATHTWAGWCTDFKNASGILRNCTANLDHAVALVNGTCGIAPLRLLLESFTLAVRFSVTQQDTESKAVENIVCFLQNITAAISSEATRNVKIKRSNSTPGLNMMSPGGDHDTSQEPPPRQASSIGCALVGSQWCLSRQNNRTATLMAAGRAGGGERRGQCDPNEKQLISVACARSLVEALLPLLADCSNPTTLEAGLGTIRNIVSIASLPLKLRDLKSNQQALIAEPGCCDVARDAVWRHGGLPIIVDLLAITSDGVLRSAASALAALGTTALGAADTDGVLVIRELIGKQALDRLVRKVPTPADAALSDAFASDAAICAILAATLVIVRPFSQQQQAAFHQQIMTPSSPAAFALHAVSDLGLVSRMLFLVRPERFGFTQVQFDAQVKRLATGVLATLWQHTELRPAYARLGIDRAAFFPSTTAMIASNMALQPQQQQRQAMMTTSAPDTLQFAQQCYMYQNSYPLGEPCYLQDQLPVKNGGGGVYSYENNSNSSNNSKVAPTAADYVVVEERLICGGHPNGSSALMIVNESANANNISTNMAGGAARIDARRGSSSSSWDNNNSVILSGSVASATVQAVPMMVGNSTITSNGSQHDDSSSLIGSGSVVTEPSSAAITNNAINYNNMMEAQASVTRAANENKVINESDERLEEEAEEENDDEMFALSQLGPGMVVDDVNEQQMTDKEHAVDAVNTATSPSDSSEQQASSATVNRDLFMLALNSDAPDSWV